MSQRKWSMLALAVLIGSPAVTTAQEPAPAPPARTPRPRVRVETGPYAYSFVAPSHARIGVVVNVRANAEKDRVGAQVEAVTPGGPAAKAGLKAGDIVTSFNGTSLAGIRPEDGEDSGPGMKLIELARELEPGDSVRLEYRRGTDPKKVTVVAEEVERRWSITQLPRMDRDFTPMDPEAFRDHVEDQWGFEMFMGQPWGRMQLVTLNPDLGEYFGTREGVLVVRAPADSGLPLKGGDVILSIDGRKLTSPSHAMRILRSYESGETIKLEVLRKRNRQTITWTVPERERGSMWQQRAPRVREREEPA